MSFAKGTDSKVLDSKQTVSDADIVSYYLGVTKIPTRICSPLRRDKKPSFGLYSRDGEHIFYTDFATGDKGSVIDLLQKLWGTSFMKTWERITKELRPLSSVKIERTTQSKVSIDVSSVHSTTMKVVTREWENYDFEYWNSYGVSKDWLIFANVYPISYVIFIKKDGTDTIMKTDKLAYVFVEFKEGNTTYKVYQPLNKHGCKWFSSHDRSVISLWTKVPEYGEKLVICSSLKDALCLWSNTGIPAVSPQGEAYGMSETAVAELKRRYKSIYILYDSDAAGIKDSIKLSSQTGFKSIMLPPFEGGKDISDKYKLLKNPAKFKAEIINILN